MHDNRFHITLCIYSWYGTTHSGLQCTWYGCGVGKYDPWLPILNTMASQVWPIIQPGKCPNCVGGGEWSGKYTIVENCSAELKSHSTCMLSCCLWCCHYTTTTPTILVHASQPWLMCPSHWTHVLPLVHVLPPSYMCPALIHMSQPSYTCPGPCTHFTILIHMSLPQSMHHGITHYFST